MTASDSGRRPSALPGSPLDAARAGLDLCVHCGFCLPACPTYLALENENDAPRGRLVLMRALLDGDVTPTDDRVMRHLDQCLGCRGCESACPSGVPYGRLLEATRATVVAARPHPVVLRIMLWIFGRGWATRLFLGAGRLLRDTGLAARLARLPGRAGFGMAMLAATRRALPVPAGAAPPRAPEGPRAHLLEGCVMESLCAHTNRATERVLARHGYRVTSAPGQGCCGALHAHAGDADTARTLARRNIAAFEVGGAEVVVSNAAGCGAMLKEYGHLLADDPVWSARAQAFAARVRDLGEVVAAAGPAPTRSLDLTVTWDAPCHLQHAQRIVTPPLAALASIPGLRHVPLRDSDQCCGAAGLYTIVEPETSQRVLAAKLAALQETGADVVVTANPGCLMQLGAGVMTTDRLPGVRPPVVVHLADLLDAAAVEVR